MTINVTRDSSGKAIGLVIGSPSLSWLRIKQYRNTSHQLVVDGDPVDWYVQRTAHPTALYPWQTYRFVSDTEAESAVVITMKDDGRTVDGKFTTSKDAKKAVEKVYQYQWFQYWTAERQLELLREFNAAEQH